MNDTLTVILSAVLAATIPLSAWAESRGGSPRMWRLIRGGAALAGALAVIVTSAWLIGAGGEYEEAVASWAWDFFFGYLEVSLPAIAVLYGILAAGYAMDHPMRRIRAVLGVLIPVGAVMVTMIFAAISSGGYFPVDGYIRALAPAYVLMGHFPMIFRRGENKSSKKV